MMSFIDDFYRKFNIQAGLDLRTQDQKKIQKTAVQNISRQNLKVLGIELTPKKSIKYPIAQLQRVDLGDGAYCYITDNKVKSEQTIFTIHGVPGSHIQWSGLQTEMSKRYRWINFLIPGFDGQDERRGNYEGDRKGMNQLFMKIIIKLSLKRIILCCHSFGTFVGYTFARQYPQFIEGFINLGGMTRNWPFGATLFVKSIIYDPGFHQKQWKDKKLFQVDSQRKKLYQKYVQSHSKEGLGTPLLKFNQYFGFLKLSLQTTQYYDDFFKNYNLAFPLLRVNIYGAQDPIMVLQKVQSTIYQLIYDQKSYANAYKFKGLLKTAKKHIQDRLFSEFGIKLDGQKIQEHLNFILEETGHAIHRRRPQQVSKIIKIYLIALQVIYQQKIISKSSL